MLLSIHRPRSLFLLLTCLLRCLLLDIHSPPSYLVSWLGGARVLLASLPLLHPTLDLRLLCALLHGSRLHHTLCLLTTWRN